MTKMRHLLLVMIAVFLVAGPSVASDGPRSDVTDTVKRSFKVRAGGTLYLDIDHGNVEIDPDAGDMVQIEIERTVEVGGRDEAKRVLERHELTFDQRGNDVEVTSRFDKEHGMWDLIRGRDKLKIRVRVLVPARYNVDFNTGAGNVSVGDIDGTVEGSTGAGNVSIGAVGGSVDISTGSGNVSLAGALGEVEVRTGAGNVELRDVQGEVSANTGAGNVVAYITRQPRADSQLESGAGNVTVFLARDIGVDVDGTAHVGNASTDFSLRVDGKWMRKSFTGEVNGGGPDLRLKAGVGNVTLRRY